ncbi:D-Ala-D-Ala carboxypeptidase family metallohydrolase [Arenimonas sp.]|uniref:D-Ala-D-Ala carboxypeptidase family metallohydrolase n=1 Tax=Arenimonas sp. TaxID=1872635 RepID=UPI0039E3CD09
MHRRRRLRSFVLILPLLCLACGDSRPRFEVWREAHANHVAAYSAFLDAQRVGGVVPLEQLLRTGRHWRPCDAEEFAVPPRASWPNIVPTLRLLRELKRSGLLIQAEVASVYRQPALNRCEGGSKASRHLANAALDLDIESDAAGVQRLCEAWRKRGPALAWGFGFYRAGKIHLDTSGFRTWGTDHHRGTSLCVTPTKP